jgi:serine/threonine-protein kinase
MATVHFGRLLGVVGFAKTVAIKRLHPQLAKDPEFVSMFLDEARLAARIRHPNVVSTLDVVALHGELFLVMEYVQGDSLRQLVRAASHDGSRMPPGIAAAILVGTLHGLHAAHEARSEQGEPLGIVHRDVSPQNILVGIDGVTRVLDFGVAKAAGRAQTTREGQLKGKLAYMSPEQLMGRGVTRSTDIFAASIVLWEALTGRRLFGGESEGEIVKKVLDAHADPPSKYVPELPRQLDELVLRGLAREPGARYASAREMARALEKCLPLAPASDIGEYVEKMAGPTLAKRAERIAKIESGSLTSGLHEAPAVAAAPSGSSWPSLVVPGVTPGDGVPPAQSPSVTTEAAPVASPSTKITLAPPSGPGKRARTPAPSPSFESSSVTNAISAIVSDSVARAASRDAELTFFRLRRRALTRVVFVAGGIAAAVIFIALGVALRDRREPTTNRGGPPTPSAEASAAPRTATGTGAPAPAVVAAPAAAASAPGEESGGAAAAEPPASSSGAATAASPTGASVGRPLPAGPHTVPRPHGSSACDPPYTVDSNGFRHYKRECVR